MPLECQESRNGSTRSVRDVESSRDSLGRFDEAWCGEACGRMLEGELVILRVVLDEQTCGEARSRRDERARQKTSSRRFLPSLSTRFNVLPPTSLQYSECVSVEPHLTAFSPNFFLFLRSSIPRLRPSLPRPTTSLTRPSLTSSLTSNPKLKPSLVQASESEPLSRSVLLLPGSGLSTNGA